MIPMHDANPVIELTERQREYLEALLSRLRRRHVGETYPLDCVERELLLIEIGHLRRLVELGRRGT